MFYLDGASYDPMTAMLGKPLGTAKSLVSRARDMLRDADARRLELDLGARRLKPEVTMTITAVLKAAQAGDAAEVRRLLGHDRPLARAKGEHDKTALHSAAARDHREVAEMLLDHGASIDDRTSWGATALEWTVNLGSADVARLLLARGAPGRTCGSPPGSATSIAWSSSSRAIRSPDARRAPRASSTGPPTLR
jgi:hypothetical protein